jgi:uncharacterized protein
MARVFYPLERFAPAPATLHLLPFRFTRLNGKELLVNEAGEFLFAPSGTVQSLAEERLETNTELYQDLKAKHFVYDNSTSPLLDVLATKVRTKFDHICGGTKLHIFVVTLRCEHSCEYCQVSRQTATRGDRPELHVADLRSWRRRRLYFARRHGRGNKGSCPYC